MTAFKWLIDASTRKPRGAREKVNQTKRAADCKLFFSFFLFQKTKIAYLVKVDPAASRTASNLNYHAGLFNARFGET